MSSWASQGENCPEYNWTTRTPRSSNRPASQTCTTVRAGAIAFPCRLGFLIQIEQIWGLGLHAKRGFHLGDLTLQRRVCFRMQAIQHPDQIDAAALLRRTAVFAVQVGDDRVGVKLVGGRWSGGVDEDALGESVARTQRPTAVGRRHGSVRVTTQGNLARSLVHSPIRRSAKKPSEGRPGCK